MKQTAATLYRRPPGETLVAVDHVFFLVFFMRTPVCTRVTPLPTPPELGGGGEATARHGGQQHWMFFYEASRREMNR